MNTIDLYTRVSRTCSRKITERYSTSFSSAIRLLDPSLRQPIYALYGFVRICDEIVDTFHDYPKEDLLSEFRRDTWLALSRGVSTNPVLQSFQETVREFEIEPELVEAFFHSMEMDLEKKDYNTALELDEYIYGSAEVVGLMCLCVFCQKDKELYAQLKSASRSLGAAFQKVNFLRDLKDDVENLSRSYFPEIDFDDFDPGRKKDIELNIMNDFKAALGGIRRLPRQARFGVYLAYRYYFSLFRKICSLQPAAVLSRRVRIPNTHKIAIIVKAGLRNKLNWI